MAGFTTQEGLEYLGTIIYKGATQQDLTMGLFTNVVDGLIGASVWADVVQPSGTGYAEIALTQGNFTVSSAGIVTYAQQQWIAEDDWSPGDVYGYYIRNNAGTPVLLHVQYRDDGVFTMTTGRVFSVDLSVNTS